MPESESAPDACALEVVRRCGRGQNTRADEARCCAGPAPPLVQWLRALELGAPIAQLPLPMPPAHAPWLPERTARLAPVPPPPRPAPPR